MSRLSVLDLPLVGLKCVERYRLGDSRGFLSRLFCNEELWSAGWSGPIAQINHTYTSKRGTVRGLHFQYPPHAEKKLVHCLRGKVWDVAVDLRDDSPTFLHWCAEELSGENGRALLIPEGFAHGFQALTDDVEMLYLHSASHNAEAEGGLNALDPRLAITWPLDVIERSIRDQAHVFTTTEFPGISRK